MLCRHDSANNSRPTPQTHPNDAKIITERAATSDADNALASATDDVNDPAPYTWNTPTDTRPADAIALPLTPLPPH